MLVFAIILAFLTMVAAINGNYAEIMNINPLNKNEIFIYEYTNYYINLQNRFKTILD